MTRTDAKLTAGLWLFALAVFLIFVSCGGGGRKSPRPVPVPTLTLTVSGGSVDVENRGCGALDQERIRGELETAWKRATGENPEVARVGWAGFRLIFATGVSGGRYVGDGAALLGCGAYGAVEHEPGHHWAHVLHLPCAGAEVWHRGGFDLRCGRLAALGHGRSRHGAFWRPASVETGVDRAPVDAETPCPLGDSIGYPLHFDKSVTSRVRCLLYERCPPAVPRSVPFVVVNTVYRVRPGWPLPDISQEGGETLPSLTHRDPAASVPVEPLVVGIGASLPHMSPRHVFGSSMPGYASWAVSATSATTASGCPRLQVVPSDAPLRPANTAAQYPRSLLCDHRPRTVAHSDSIPQTVADFAHQLRVHCDLSPSGSLDLIDHLSGWNLACERLP